MKKDLFSAQATTYKNFRPTYPEALFRYLAGLTQPELVWDCGTGNGQAAASLARYFKKVIATDGSAKQLAEAPALPNVEYRVATAEASALPSQSCDLITVAQALHWFDLDAFFAEVKRILKPTGHVAVWCYGNSFIAPEIDRIDQHFYAETLNGYWDPLRRLIDEGYRNIPFPFREIKTPPFELEVDWTLDQFVGYIDSWSAVQAYKVKNGKSPIPELKSQLEKVWGEGGAAKRKVSWPLNLRVGSSPA